MHPGSVEALIETARARAELKKEDKNGILFNFIRVSLRGGL